MAETILEGVFMNIPTHIITDILARLPPYTLVQCRCVCKAWLKLIKEPEFVNLHLSKSPTYLIVQNMSHDSVDSASFSLVEVEDEVDHHSAQHIAGMDRKIPKKLGNVYTNMTMIGSIDGLVCINEFAYQCCLIHIWNPTMHEFITVQTPAEEKKYPNVTTYGFGIRSGKYLVVRIFQENEITDSTTNSRRIRDSTCYVYTIGDGVWKSIGHAPYIYSFSEHGLFFNGNLHWLIYDSLEKICCLDLEKELFQPFPHPPELSQGNLAKLNLYKGCLSTCNTTTPDMDIVIWVMKEYGVQNSWSKEMVISQHSIAADIYDGFYIIKVFKDGEILLLCRDYMLFSYHPKRKTVQVIDVKESMTGPSFRTHPCIETTEYVSSIVSLKSLGKLT